jgi:hypothetical protein
MDHIQKSKILLTHWIAHNCEHLRGYLEVAENLERADLVAASNKIRDGVRLIEQANSRLEEALKLLPEEDWRGKQGAVASGVKVHDEADDHAHGHSHHHDHPHRD